MSYYVENIKPVSLAEYFDDFQKEYLEKNPGHIKRIDMDGNYFSNPGDFKAWLLADEGFSLNDTGEANIETLKPIDYGDIINIKQLILASGAGIAENNILLEGDQSNNFNLDISEKSEAIIKKKISLALAEAGIMLNGYYTTGIECIFFTVKESGISVDAFGENRYHPYDPCGDLKYDCWF